MGFCISKEDGVVFHFEDAGIGDSHFEDIRGEIFQAGFRGTDGLRVDIPVKLPDLGRDLIEETGIFHGLFELGLKDFGERSDREIKIDPGGMPETVSGGEGSAGDDVMDMGVIF